MSENSTLVTAQHFSYVAERTTREDAFLADLKKAAEAVGIPPIWIAPEQASFMQILFRAARVKDVVEVGTLAGYSAIAMARALPEDGRIRTIEINPKHAAFTERWVAKSDVAGRVEVHVGSGHDILPTFADQSADAVFLDADKKSYASYLDQATRILGPGGLVLVDNAFAFGELFAEDPGNGEVPAVRAFNEHMASRGDFTSVIVPMGDGVWMGVKN